MLAGLLQSFSTSLWRLQILGQSSQLYLVLPPSLLKTQTTKESDGTTEDLCLPHSHMIKLKGQPAQLAVKGKHFV